MKFYDCQPAPSPRRARIFIAEKGLDIETVQVDLGSREQLGPEFQAINPYCTVPVLELDDGTRLNSTAGIWNYLEAESGTCFAGHHSTGKGRDCGFAVAHRD